MVAFLKNLFPLFLFILVSACQSIAQIEPIITYSPPPQLIEQRPSPFSPLTAPEYHKDWGKELVMGNTFASELDFYRAITCYKRGLILIPPSQKERRMQIEYGILECYYLAGKFQEAVLTYENSTLRDLPPAFPAFDDLLIILYDSYLHIGQTEKASLFLKAIESRNKTNAQRLKLSHSIQTANLCELSQDPSTYQFLDAYESKAKSVSTAKTLNALLPGAGYFYVGQKQTAFTSFIINSLFIAAAYHFFSHKNIAAGMITSSLEYGWYVGGINGAGLAAKEYNERVYETVAKEHMMQNGLFPVLMLQYSF